MRLWAIGYGLWISGLYSGAGQPPPTNRILFGGKGSGPFCATAKRLFECAQGLVRLDKRVPLGMNGWLCMSRIDCFL